MLYLCRFVFDGQAAGWTKGGGPCFAGCEQVAFFNGAFCALSHLFIIQLFFTRSDFGCSWIVWFGARVVPHLQRYWLYFVVCQLHVCTGWGAETFSVIPDVLRKVLRRIGLSLVRFASQADLRRKLRFLDKGLDGRLFSSVLTLLEFLAGTAVVSSLLTVLTGRAVPLVNDLLCVWNLRRFLSRGCGVTGLAEAGFVTGARVRRGVVFIFRGFLGFATLGMAKDCVCLEHWFFSVSSFQGVVFQPYSLLLGLVFHLLSFTARILRDVGRVSYAVQSMYLVDGRKTRSYSSLLKWIHRSRVAWLFFDSQIFGSGVVGKVVVYLFRLVCQFAGRIGDVCSGRRLYLILGGRVEVLIFVSRLLVRSRRVPRVLTKSTMSASGTFSFSANGISRAGRSLSFSFLFRPRFKFGMLDGESCACLES